MQVDAQSMEIQITREAARGMVMKSPILYANVPIMDMKH